MDEDAHNEDAGVQLDEEPQPLVRVRYGLAKELRLYPDTLDIVHLEEHETTQVSLNSVKRMILAPGDPNPSKLVLMFDLDDGQTIIAAEGVSNVRDFRKLIAKLQEIHPEIELDPPDMDIQLAQALDIRRRSMIGCYGSVIGACLLVWILYLVVAFIGAHAGH